MFLNVWYKDLFKSLAVLTPAVLEPDWGLFLSRSITPFSISAIFDWNPVK